MNNTTTANTAGASQFHQPGHLFSQNDKFGVSFWPADGNIFEILLRKRQGSKSIKYEENSSCTNLKFDKTPGDYVLQFRWKKENSDENTYSDLSPIHKFSVLEETERNVEKIKNHRIIEHQLEVMTSRLSNGVRTLHNPWFPPPNFPETSAKWFATACYEGSTPLINQTQDYYTDPLKYLIESVKSLIDKKANFLTWKNIVSEDYKQTSPAIPSWKKLIFGKNTDKPFNCILQFDIDAGVKSFFKVASELEKLNIVGSVMVHRKSHDWYAWDIEDLNIERLQALEKKGWEIGYHNNSLSNEQRLERAGDYSDETLKKATLRFSKDITYLRQYFNIEVYTHHGGNVFNRFITPDPSLDVLCVDRRISPELWRKVDGKFSDGGFFARPCPLKEHIETLQSGLHFFRLHPLKYGNFNDNSDISPLNDYEEPKDTQEILDKASRGLTLNDIEKQTLWFSMRAKGRKGYPLSHASLAKPISSKFNHDNIMDDKISQFRAKRRETFLQMYPWPFGDPRVFWWHMLNSFSIDGDILNIGAMPPGQKDETTAFLPKNANFLEMDIDPEREPDILDDFSHLSAEFTQKFNTVLLFGLPCFEYPKKAIDNCHKSLKPGGRALIGFCGDTHPERGGLWNPVNRPVWRPDKYLKPPLAHNTKIWSFDKEAVTILFENWPGSLKIEYHSHYWFVVGERQK